MLRIVVVVNCCEGLIKIYWKFSEPIFKMDTPVTRKEFETLKDSVRDNADSVRCDINALNQKLDAIIQKLNHIETQSLSSTFRRSGEEEGSYHADLGGRKPPNGEERIVMEETLLKEGQGRKFFRPLVLV